MNHLKYFTLNYGLEMDDGVKSFFFFLLLKRRGFNGQNVFTLSSKRAKNPEEKERVRLKTRNEKEAVM